MSFDISDILDAWPFETGKIAVRKIRGSDGREKIQLRLDLGLLQMEMTGRPDGRRPHGHQSLLHYHEHRLEQYEKSHGNDKGFSLDEKACELLRAESMMYYHRYLASFVLEDYDAVVRDTLRNLRLMDFCGAYAAETSDRYILEQYRSYVLMMWSRASAQGALRDSRPKAALAAAREGIKLVEEFYRKFDQADHIKESTELAVLRALAKEIESGIPVSPLTKLRRQLARAVSEERYEDAAAVRDLISKVETDSPSDD